MWYFSAAGAPENGQNVISVGKSVLYRVITPSVRKTAGFYPPYLSVRKGREGGGKNRWDSTDVIVSNCSLSTVMISNTGINIIFFELTRTE